MYAKYITVVSKILPFVNPISAEATWNTITDPIRVALGDVTVPTGPFYRFLYTNPQVAFYIAVSAPLFIYLYEITFPNNYDAPFEVDYYENYMEDVPTLLSDINDNNLV